MSRSASHPAAVVAALALVGAACSSSATDPRDSPLTAREAGALAASLASQSLAGLAGTAGVITSGVGTANGSRFSFTADCPLGGTVGGSAEVTNSLDASGAGTVAGTVQYAPSTCAVSTGSRTVTLDGDPSVLTTFSLAYTNLAITPALTSTVTGAVRVSGAACALDYTVSAPAGGRPSLAGNVCGREVSGTY